MIRLQTPIILNPDMTLETCYRCPDCHYERTLTYGTQWQHVDELHRYRRDIERGKYGDQAKKWLLKHPEGILTISTALFTCQRCGTLKAAERLLLEFQGVRSWETPVRCATCHVPCQLLISPPPSLPCTACGKTCFSTHPFPL